MIFHTKKILPIVILATGGFASGKWIGDWQKNDASIPKKEGVAPSSLARPHAFVKSNRSSVLKNSNLGDQFLSGSKGQQLTRILTQLLRGDSPKDWEATLQQILDCTEESGRSSSLLLLFSKWAEVDFQGALERSGKLMLHAPMIKREIFTQLAEKNPAEAVIFCKENKALLLSNYHQILGDITRIWAIQNPTEALEWCFSQTGSDKNQALRYYFRGVGYDQSDEVIKVLDSITARGGAIPLPIIADWAEADSDAVLNWSGFNSGKIPKSIETIISGIVKSDPDKATEIMLSLPDNSRLDMATGIALRINDPMQKMTWIMSVLQPSEVESKHLSGIRLWTNQNQEKAESWIRDLADIRVRDMAIEVYAENVRMNQTWESVLNFIDSIEDNAKREAVLASTLKRWNKRNPQYFKSWLEQETNSRWKQVVKENTL